MRLSESDLTILLKSMKPRLNDGVYVFASITHEIDLRNPAIIAMIREKEGLSIIITEAEAIRQNLPILCRAAWITLTVFSDLNAVGFTAAIAKELTLADISCNVVAGAHHDHLFVPFEKAEIAMNVLKRLQNELIN